MSEPPGILGAGTKFFVSANETDEPSIRIARLLTLKPPSSTKDRVDVTNMDSEDLTKESIPGWRDPGEASMTGNFIPGSDGDEIIQDWDNTGQTRPCRVEWPNGVIWDFKGYVGTYEVDASFDDKMTFSLSIQVTGSTVPGLKTT